MLADEVDYVVGVDPHRDEHALAVEGTGSFGVGLTRFLISREERVLEVGRLRRERQSGKSDALDAVRAARSVLGQTRPARPRAGGEREALRALTAAREGAVTARRAGLCQLRGLLVSAPEPLRAELRSLTRAQLLRRLVAVRPGRCQDPELRGTLLALRALARRVTTLTVEERELAHEIETLTRKLAPQLLEQPGVGPLAAAQVLISWSHRGRITSEAAFARLAGCAPIPASSGQTVRYRLDRSGDRRLNRALHMILVTRRRAHAPTIASSTDASKKARVAAKQPAVSSATSPEASTDSSRTRRRRLDRHGSIARAGEVRLVRGEATLWA